VTLGVGDLDAFAIKSSGVEAIVFDDLTRHSNGGVARLFERRELISARVDMAVLPVTDIEEELWHGRSLSPGRFQTVKRCDWFRVPLRGGPVA